MKLFIQILLLIPSMTFGQACKIDTPLAAEFQQQESWQEILLEEPNKIPVPAMVDAEHNLHLLEIQKRKDLKTIIDLDMDRSDHFVFKRWCRDYTGEAKRLTRLRENRHPTPFDLQLNFLPNFSDFANDPLKAFDRILTDAVIEYTPQSLVSQSRNSDHAKAEIHDLLARQVAHSPFGQVQFDLTGLHDFVCDVIQGQAKIYAQYTIFSRSPVVEQRELFSQNDLNKLTSSWAQQFNFNTPTAEAIFYAGIEAEKMRARGDIENIDNKKLFQVAEKLIVNNSAPMASLSPQKTKCLYESLQEYIKPQNYNLINVGLELDTEAILLTEDAR